MSMLENMLAEGIDLWLEGGALRYRGPKERLDEWRVAELRKFRDVLIDELLQRQTAPAVLSDPAGAYEPFPLTNVQAAYLLGRRSEFEAGGVGCHGYIEIERPALDSERVAFVWNRLIERHHMLRATFSTDGTQRVAACAPRISVERDQVAWTDAREFSVALLDRRRRMSHRVYGGEKWPLFGLAVTQGPEKAVLHISFDLLVADFLSFERLLHEFGLLYAEPARTLPPLSLTFRDYQTFVNRMRGSRGLRDRDKKWWKERIESIPAGPALPSSPQSSVQHEPPTFEREKFRLEPPSWDRLRREAANRGLTPTTAVLTTFCEVIATSSGNRPFSLVLTVFDRESVHPDVNEVVGDFSSITLLEVSNATGATREACARRLQERLWEDLDHKAWSGVEVIRELARSRGASGARFPVAFTSTLGITRRQSDADSWSLGAASFGITQTPQVWLDCQVSEYRTGLHVALDFRKGILSSTIVERMAEELRTLLLHLSEGGSAWTAEGYSRACRSPREGATGRGNQRKARMRAVRAEDRCDEPTESNLTAAADGDDKTSETRSRVTQIIRGAFRSVLDASSFGDEEDFISLGGNSLLAARAAGILKEELRPYGNLSFDELLVAILRHRCVRRLVELVLMPDVQETRCRAGLFILTGEIDPNSRTVATIAFTKPEAVYLREVLEGTHASVSHLSLELISAETLSTIDDSTMVERCADACARLVEPKLGGGRSELVLMAGQTRGILALEVARRLREGGANVHSLVIMSTTQIGVDIANLGRWSAAARRFVPFPYAGDVVLLGSATVESTVNWEEIALGTLLRRPNETDFSSALQEIVSSMRGAT